MPVILLVKPAIEEMKLFFVMAIQVGTNKYILIKDLPRFILCCCQFSHCGRDKLCLPRSQPTVKKSLGQGLAHTCINYNNRHVPIYMTELE